MPKVTPLSVHLKFQGRREYPLAPGIDDWGLNTDQQESYVEQFRRILLAKNAFNVDDHDYYALRRFLRARSYDLEKATKMWLDSLAFRRDQKVDSILQDFYFPERDKFIASFPQGYHKCDKQGRPIYYQIMGKLNLPELMTITTEERLLKFHIQEYERATRVILPVCSKLCNRSIDTTFGILDVKGVGMSHLSSEVKRLLQIITKIDSNNYPEAMGHMCIINAPGLFRLMWSMIKGMLDPRTQSKIEILGPNYKQGLLEWIDEENLPEWMGGTSKGGLVDDVGPWSDPEVLSRLDLDVETMRRGRSATMESQMAQVSMSRARSMASRQPSLMLHSLPTAPPPSGGEAAGNRLGVVAEDLLHPQNSIQRPSLTPDSPGASGIARTVTLATLADLLSSEKPRTLVERIVALEKLMPGQLERLKLQVGAANVAHSAALSTRSAPEGSLLHRVETMEDALSTLLAAQEVSIQQQQADAALCEMRAQVKPRGCCGACCIM